MTACPILQFGTSRFLQAHVDLFVSEANAGPIAVVQTTGSPDSRRRIAGFRTTRPYPVHLRGLADGQPVDRTFAVNSIAAAFDADHDWHEVKRHFIHDAQWIISNTGDRGYEPHLDDRPNDAPPHGFPAKLTTLLHARWQAGAPAPTLLPCELISDNGRILRDAVLAIAQAWSLDPAFLAWLTDACRWMNSLVDRIVPTSLDPVGAIAEPYALWAIEDQPGFIPPCHHPDIRVVPDLAPYERLKLHILNLGHTVLAETWHAAGRNPNETVVQAIADPLMSGPLAIIYDSEVLPVFAALGMATEAATYRATVLDRFANPHLQHRLADIYVNHGAKKLRRIGAFLDLAHDVAPTHPTPILTRMLRSGID